MTFFEDIKSKHLTSYVLVTIGNPIVHRISTQKVRLGDDYYKPILLSIPSISESLDIENRKYKISSVSLSISDYEEDGVRFSDGLSALMNKEVNIYYASQSSQALNESECYPAGTFIIRSFSQDEDKIVLNCEDLSQDKLHKDLPLESITPNDNIMEKYHNKPIPMVFGQVKKSPCIATIHPDETGEMVIIADETSSESYIDNATYAGFSDENDNLNNNPLLIFRNDVYVSVFNSAPIGIWGDLFTLPLQYTSPLTDDPPRITLNVNISSQAHEPDKIRSLLSLDFAAVMLDDTASRKMLVTETEHSGTSSTVYEAENFGDEVSITTTQDPLVEYKQYSEKHLFPALPDHVLESRRLNADGEVVNDDIFGKIVNFFIIRNLNVQLSNFEGEEGSYSLEGNNIELEQWTASQGDDDISFTNTLYPFGLGVVEGEVAHKKLEADFVLLHNFPSDNTIGRGARGILDIGSVQRGAIYIIDKFHTSNFYARVVGRGGLAPTLKDIYSHILGVDVLNFAGYNSDLVDPDSLGEYAFTIDKKINSKKLLEEISASSGLFPFFKNGNFNVKSIKKAYGDTNNIIMTEDIINYKYDRTSINKVYTKVNVFYHYDYGLKEFTKETGDVTPTESGLYSGYSEDFFGEGFDQELVFESKYIRDETTALNLAKYLCGLHANQHNLITLTLPLNYLELELGDIVKLDKLIQGRKMFGEEYHNIVNTLRNGQNIYPLFFIDKIKKNLDKVEVRLYQLHQFDAEAGATSPIYGCTDSDAVNYDNVEPATMENGSCIYLNNQVMGCSTLGSVNYIDPNTLAEGFTVYEDGTCVAQLPMASPVIQSPEDDSTVQGSETIIITSQYSDNLITDSANSTFDENVVGESFNPIVSCDVFDDSSMGLIGATESPLSVPTLYFTPFQEPSLLGGTAFVDGVWDSTWGSSGAFWGYYVVNLITGAYSQIISSTYNPVIGFVMIGLEVSVPISGDSWQIISSPEPLWEEGELFTTAWSATGGGELEAGEGTLIYTNQDWVVNSGLLYDLDGQVSIEEGDIFKVEFRIRKLVGSAEGFRVFLGTGQNMGGGMGTTFLFEDNYWDAPLVLERTMTSSYSDPDFQIVAKSGEESGLLKFEIDDVILRRYTTIEETIINDMIAPEVNVVWNHSSSLGESFPNLDGLITDGWYRVFLSTLEAGTPATAPVETMVKRALTGFRLATFLHSSDGYTADQFQGSTVSVMDGSHSGSEFIVNTAYYQNQGNNDWLVLTLNSGGMSAETFATISQGDDLLITFNDGGEPTQSIVYPPVESPDINKVIYEGGDTASHLINFGDFYAPQNVDLILKVVAYCENRYNGTALVFDPQGELIPQAESVPHSIKWVTGDGGIDTSSAVGNSGLNNTTIDNIEERLGNPKLDINRLIDDIVGKE